MGPWFILYTTDIVKPELEVIVTVFDDNAVTLVGKDHEEAREKPQIYIDKINTWKYQT